MRRLPLFAILASLSLCCVALFSLGFEASRASQAQASADESRDGDAGGAWIDVPLDTPAAGMRFGIDASAVGRFAEHAGAPPDYGTIWVGKWNLDHGWRGTDTALDQMRDAGVTPAVHFWYWGDDIRSDCLDFGCNGKDVAGWDRLASDLAWHLQDRMRGAEVVVILESEFNKHGAHDDERFDTMLADKAYDLRQQYPAVKVVLGFGNWYPEAWGWFDQAAAASDYVGLQALAATTRDSDDRMLDLLNSTLEGAWRLHETFGKPVFVQDVAVSSYPEPDNLYIQERSLARFAGGMAALQQAGVEAVLYRSFLDVPDMGLGNHFAEAERHWGLAWHDTGELKPAGQAWISAVQRARQAVVAGEAFIGPAE